MMIHKLDKADFPKASGLFASLAAYKLSVNGVLDDTQLGTVFVDDRDTPQSAVMYWNQLLLLAGKADNHAFNQALQQLLLDKAFVDAAEHAPDGVVALVDTPAWINQFPVIFGDRTPIEESREHLIWQPFKFNWREKIPDDVTVRRIDAALLQNEALFNVEELQEAIDKAWAESAGEFIQRGLGVCALIDDDVAGWCFTRIVHNQSCELTLETLREYAGQGLATLVSAAAIEFCQQAGFTHIDEHIAGWNLASLRVAEKVGFVTERAYPAYAYYFDPATHYSVAGEIHLKFQRFKEALQNYDLAIAAGEDSLPTYYNGALAAAHLDDREVAFQYLQLAIIEARGLIPVAMVMRIEVFKKWHDTPDWKALLRQMGR
jgi:RimJ/RimL family protein N-acetyltransferase